MRTSRRARIILPLVSLATVFALAAQAEPNGPPPKGAAKPAAHAAPAHPGAGPSGGHAAGAAGCRTCRDSVRPRSTQRPSGPRQCPRPQFRRTPLSRTPRLLGRRTLAPRSPQRTRRLLVGCRRRLVLLSATDGSSADLHFPDVEVMDDVAETGPPESDGYPPPPGGYAPAAAYAPPPPPPPDPAASAAGGAIVGGLLGRSAHGPAERRDRRGGRWRRNRSDRRRPGRFKAGILSRAGQLLLSLSLGPIRARRSRACY